MIKLKAISVVLITFSTFNGMAQDSILKKRYSFAKTYFGLDMNHFHNLQQTYFLNEQNQLQVLNRSNFITPAINFGATHFWGHADFFVSIASSSIKMKSEVVENNIRFGALTGMRIFPWALKKNSFRPYLSYKFAAIRLNQSNLLGEQFRKTRVKSIIGIGLGFQTRKIYAYLGYELIPNNELSIYLSRSQTANSSFPKSAINLGINYSIEFTSGSYMHPIPKLDSILRSKNTLGWFFGIGPSSAFPTKNSSYIAEIYPFLDNRAMSSIFSEITVGYHFSKHDFAISANFRPIRQERNSFSFNQRLIRNSFGLEAYKFLFDYHGFAPFIGAGLLFENIKLHEYDYANKITNDRFGLTSPSLVFGWDIRPSKRADIWLLRTNLRYSPFLEISKSNKKISLQHLEFNFIQAVFYPKRINKYKKLLR